MINTNHTYLPLPQVQGQDFSFDPSGALLSALEQGNDAEFKRLLDLTLPAIQDNEKLIYSLFCEMADRECYDIARLLLESYVLIYPSELGRDLLNPNYGTRSLSLLKEFVSKREEFQIERTVFGECLCDALAAQMPEMASFLLDYVEDLSYFDDHDNFYYSLFAYSDTQFVEQAIAKFGISEEFFHGYHSNEHVLSLYQNHPVLFHSLVDRLFTLGVELCRGEKFPSDIIYSPNLRIDSRYLRALATISGCSGKKDLVQRCYDEFLRPKKLQWLIDEMMMHAVKDGHLPNELRDFKGNIDLFRAAERGDSQEVKRLLALGSDVNFRGDCNMTVLGAAVMHLVGNMSSNKSVSYSLIEVLISRDALCTEGFDGNENIFDFAFRKLEYGLLSVLHPKFTPNIQLNGEALAEFFSTCEEKDLEFISTYYPNLDLKDTSVCHAFIQRNRLDLLKKLEQLLPHLFKKYLEIKTPIDGLGSHTPLACALVHKNWEIVNFLRSAGATFDKDPEILVIAPEITKQFLDEGMNSNEQDLNGQSALHYLARRDEDEDLACLPLLLASGADILLPDVDKETPLQKAYYENNFEFMQVILKTEQFKSIPFPKFHQAVLRNDLDEIKQMASSDALKEDDWLSCNAFELAIMTHSLEAVHLLSHHDKHSWEHILNFTAVWGSGEVFSFLFSREKEKENPDRIFYLYSVGNNSVVEWIGEHYASSCPHAFHQFFRSKSLNEEALLRKKCSELRQNPEGDDVLRWLFIEMLEQNQLQKAYLLLDFLNISLDNQRSVYSCLVKYGNRKLIEKVISITGFPACLKDLLPRALKEGVCEIIDWLLEIIPYHWGRSYQEEMIAALKAKHDKSFQILLNAYEKHHIAQDTVWIYTNISINAPKETKKNHFLWMMRAKDDFAEDELEEIADLLISVSAYPSAVAYIAAILETTSSLCEVKEAFHRVSCYIQKLTISVPCGNLSPYATVDWLIDQVFNYCREMNPKLFPSTEAFTSILNLILQVQKNEEYGALLLAFQVAPDIGSAACAFRVAQLLGTERMVKPSKPELMGKSVEEQKSWLAYALVYRDRSFLPHCSHIIKYYKKYPNILIEALQVLACLGIKRYKSSLENTLSSRLPALIIVSKDEKVKIAALQAFMVMTGFSRTPEVLDFLLAQLQRARRLCSPEYEVALLYCLADYEWVSDLDCVKAVKALLTGVKSPSLLVRMETAKVLASIPDEQGLFAALDVVQSSAWDPKLRDYGKDKMNITGSFLKFKRRPDEIHDNRSGMINRIMLQLVHVYEKRGLFNTITAEHPLMAKVFCDILKEFSSMSPIDTRHMRMTIAYPPRTDLIRGISTRKGITKFREAVRDLLRKGAGSCELTDYNTCVYSNTWNKIGHSYASHNKDLFFGIEGGSSYFSVDANNQVSDGALIVFPAEYYHKEFRAGQARIEREATINNVLYRGIPQRWIKSVYLPLRFKHDIELLAGKDPLESVEKKFKSDLFRGDSIKELKTFRRLLTAREVDLTGQDLGKEVSFVEKIRYFPPVNAKKVGEILEKDGVTFATYAEIFKETSKLHLKKKLLVKKIPQLMDQVSLLIVTPDHFFKQHADHFFKMMPQSLGECTRQRQIILGEGGSFGLKTDDLGHKRVFLRVAALLLGKPAKEILSENPRFYGLSYKQITIVEALHKHFMFVGRMIDPNSLLLTKEDLNTELTAAFGACKTKELSFHQFCFSLVQLYVAQASLSEEVQAKVSLYKKFILENKNLEFETFQWVFDLRSSPELLRYS